MIILYPTETIYGLGVNALDADELKLLYDLKGRDSGKAVSWLVRDVHDITTFAILSPLARLFAEHFLPGPLTLVLPVKASVPIEVTTADRTVGFRVSSDKKAQAVIATYMTETGAPLTCTSANISGEPTLTNPTDISAQFSAQRPEFAGFDRVIDGGIRTARASTVVSVIDDTYEILREGLITREALMTLANNL